MQFHMLTNSTGYRYMYVLIKCTCITCTCETGVGKKDSLNKLNNLLCMYDVCVPLVQHVCQSPGKPVALWHKYM